MPIRKQFKVRLIEKPLSPTMELDASATTATVIQTLMMKSTASFTKWPIAKPTPMPLTIHNVPSAKNQETPSSSMQKLKEKRAC